ncbi:LPS export ABC transporter permease LptG [Gallibacterium melopsittaci]|uniref:LPS export ABC transporter permease LptG n=1 Tax=Gallibacterium melopsittaci TaxID=516063 RepID=A0ABV6HVC6_9PAST
MFNALDRYIGKTILATIFVTLFLLVGLSAIIKFVEQFRAIGEGNYDTLKAIAYTLLTIPKDIETFFPMAALLGALIGLGSLASNSELVVMQASGFSRFQIGMAVMKTAIPLIVLNMALGEWGIPQTEQFAREMRYKSLTGGSLLSVKGSIWAKDGNSFVYIQNVPKENELEGIYIYQFDQERNLKKLSQANRAVYKNNEWHFNQLSESILDEDKVTNKNYLNLPWKTSITPDKLGIVSLRPSMLSISGLSEYIQFLKNTGQDTKTFELTYWRKILQPISISVMMLLALSFIFGPLRSVTPGVRVVTGICCGFTFYVLDEVFGPLSLVYNIPPIIGALAPSVFFAVIIWWLMVHKRH